MLNLLPKEFETLINRDGKLLYFENFLDAFTVDELIQDINWRNDPITMYGKTYPQPRLTAWYGEPGLIYTYSNIKMTALPWTPVLFNIKNLLEQTLDTTFNSVLLNYYRNGSDHMSYHADDEKELGPNPTIASLSFGAARNFQLKHRYDSSEKTFIKVLDHGSLLVMKDELQHFWVHKIAKTQKPIGPRLNLTFRKIYS